MATATIPLCNELDPADPKNGTIDLYTGTDITKLEGLFSFTLYVPNLNTNTEKVLPPIIRKYNFIVNSLYYKGIQSYLHFINTNLYFEKWGVIIYCDADSFPILQEAFEGYPKLILAKVTWPY